MEQDTLMAPSEALTRGFVLEQPLAVGAAASPRGTAVTASAAGARVRQGFRVGGLNLMVRYEDGSELTEMPEVFRLPNVPGWFRGIANLHGMLTPVFDLSRYLGVAPDSAARQMLLVLSHGANAAGMVIDGLPQRLRWTSAQDADAGAAPPKLASQVRGAALIGEQLWFDIESAALLDALEQAMAGLH